MQEFAFVDETLDLNLTLSYKLSIQVSLNGLSFCILDPVRNKFIALSHKNFEKDLLLDDLQIAVEDYIDSNELLNKEYKSTLIIWESFKCTLIPDKYFDDKNLKKYFELNHKLDDLDEIHYKKLKYSDSHTVFAVPNQIAGILSRKFKAARFYNQQIPFVDTILFKHHSEAKKVFVNINNDFIDIAISQKGKLQFYNAFNFKSDNDILYFIVNVYEQQGLDTEHTELVLSGIKDKKTEFYTMLKEFIGHVKFEKNPDEFTYSYTFSKIPEHTFTNLFNLQLCE
jgi:Protein of unknown function (DUF3822)